MKENDILELFYESGALLRGHFLLTSGKHSDRYVQCAQVLKHAAATEKLVAALAGKLTQGYDLVIGPAMGGVIVAYEMGRQLGVPSIFTEREQGVMTLRRGFEIPRDSRVLVVEDVITTGGSVQEVVELVQAAGGNAVEAAVLVDRSRGDHVVSIPVTSLLELSIDTFEAEKCPLCKHSRPVKPGSRKING